MTVGNNDSYNYQIVDDLQVFKYHHDSPNEQSLVPKSSIYIYIYLILFYTFFVLYLFCDGFMSWGGRGGGGYFDVMKKIISI